MMRAGSLVHRFFLAILAVALLSVLIAGVIIRTAFFRAFSSYLGGMLGAPMTGPRGPGMARLMQGVAEQAFLSSVNRGIVFAAIIAVSLAVAVALLVSRYLTGPLEHLTVAARSLSGGDLSTRVDVEGPVEVKELAEAFNDMAVSIDEAERLRRRLVADVAHELRNPVAAARAQAEAMSEGVLEPSPERLDSLVDDLRGLSRLVDDLQELSVAEAGRLRYEREAVDVCGVARREVERVVATVPSEVTVRVECPSEPAIVHGDEGRLTQVVRNLLDNAVRHTRRGRIVARVTRTPEGPVSVDVEDTGEGIPEEDLPFIFERFYRADGARASKTGGAGIGLAISRRIVADHGGTMHATSQPGVRTVVGMTLPVREESDTGRVQRS